jgi:hypothetical protein
MNQKMKASHWLFMVEAGNFLEMDYLEMRIWQKFMPAGFLLWSYPLSSALHPIISYMKMSVT